MTQAIAVVLVCAATVAVGALGLRLSRTTSDFYVASRMVSPRWNASAIGGEYLSAASFLGVAGLVLAAGTDMLWYPVGYTAGYLVLLVLVAAPLRRSGAYTLPDFAEIRTSSPAVRRAASLLVVGIGWLYLLPQFRGAGLTLRTVSGAPSWVGSTVVAVVVVASVAAGGMRSITLVQAFQYWLKLTAIAFPALLLIVAWGADGAPDPVADRPPVAADTITVTLADPVRVQVDVPVTLTVDGTVDGAPARGALPLPAPGQLTFGAGTTIVIPAGAVVPRAEDVPAGDGASWVAPVAADGADDHPVYRTYSLLLALLLGTMGLPHVIVRFYTNPDGRAARRTAAVVVGLLGVFYLFPPVYAALGRIYAPDLLLTGRTDAVVLLLPERMLPAPWGEAMSALVTAGAFAAFLSTASGLTVSVAGVLSQDLLRGRARASVAGFRAGSLIAVVVPAALSLLTVRVGLADTVGLAFAMAASTFCPLLVLGIWWRRLTAAGALAGLATGGLLAGTAVIVTMTGMDVPGVAGVLLAQPAAWTVPLAFVVTIAVSLLTPGSAPADAARVLVRLHAPERLALATQPMNRRTATSL
ncbi:Sodium:solute symporter family protein [Parafrankia irregularis]|uniref:Sodium:solute symporter family protein n=1 Tax=Parafrankia irregularis TaxID=795642 RepID=A0A0S4QP22_9ACTN|nr:MULTISPECIES: cation acetate symporter [Parafrankia]MBE3200516.1 cation acetate symporter [Parafrankia sp. CH37]CUU56847.1 Sodium:solute symporter family protein [Parafrankia irregularis]